MILAQIFLLLFILFALSRVVLKFKKKVISLRELLFWLFVWLAAFLAVLLPDFTSYFARLSGIGRGVDLAIYFSLIILFYTVFRIFIRLERIEKDITKITRKIALQEKKED